MKYYIYLKRIIYFTKSSLTAVYFCLACRKFMVNKGTGFAPGSAGMVLRLETRS